MRVRLSPMPKGKGSKGITRMQKEYIDEHHPYENITRMAKMLNIPFIDVQVYCMQKSYEPPKHIKAKPKKAAKNDTFDIDQYNPATI